MTNQHPITPPPELVREWIEPSGYKVIPEWLHKLLQTAAQWGADQELDACCEWLNGGGYAGTGTSLRAARRPKPLSLKEQALEALDRMDQLPTLEDMNVVRRALEQLDD